MIIGKKGAEGLPLISRQDIEAVVQGLDGQLKNGLPAEVPVGVPVGQFASLAKTCVEYINLAEELTNLSSEDENFAAVLASLQMKAKDLLTYKPPAVKASPLLTP